MAPTINFRKPFFARRHPQSSSSTERNDNEDNSDDKGITDPSNDDSAIRFSDFALHAAHPQTQSPLFSTIPAELRDRIFEFALSPYDDAARPYPPNTPYTRPENAAPTRTDTALLRACKRIYAESWFRPFTSAEHTFWLAAHERRPSRVPSRAALRSTLDLIHHIHGDPMPELAHARVYAQLWALEAGWMLAEIVQLARFLPRAVTVTVRHTDWWYWERDEVLRIDGAWVGRCTLPPSVKQLRLELESLERRKDQIDAVARQMASRWKFRRADDVVLAPEAAPPRVRRWTGPSTWEAERWVRDEPRARPGCLDYYVATVSFVPARDVRGDTLPHGTPNIRLPSTFHPLSVTRPSLTSQELSAAGVPEGAGPDEALRMVEGFEARRREESRATREAADDGMDADDSSADNASSAEE